MEPVLAIETVGLTKDFGRFRAVDGVSLSVAAGSVYAVLGPNGAGKTTVVRMLATLLRPNAGHARIFGHDVVSEATAVRSLIGVTGQYASVDEDLTAVENLRVFARLRGMPRSQAREITDQLLEEFSLTEAADRALRHFSGGMRRRLDLAASLLTRPPLLFLDEPTTGLDPRTRAQMWDTVRRLVSEGVTVLLTTQYLDEADHLADRIAVIDRGKLVADGTADDLKSAVGNSTLKMQVAIEDSAAAAQLVAGIVGGDVSLDAGALTVSVADGKALPEVLIAMRTSGIEVDEVTVTKPSLDEVFFAITGNERRAGEAASGGESTGRHAAGTPEQAA